MALLLFVSPAQWAALPAHARAAARVLVPTDVSGGSLRALLTDAAARFGAERVVAELRCTAMDFPLPCFSGEGRALTRGELAALRRRAVGPVFFSEALCAKYFTLREDDGWHFILFDDAQTLRQKRALARSLGIRDAVCFWEELSDAAPQFLADG